MKRSKRDVRYSGVPCSLEVIVEVLGGKWKPGILFNLLQQPMRFGQLRKKLGPITERMLAKQLRELASAGVVSREDFGEIPPRVQYSLTDYGRTLETILRQMEAWGTRHAARVERSRRVANPNR